MLVWTAGDGVNAFVLERGIGEFVLWREKSRMPERGKTYGVNQANAARWHPGARALLERLTGPKDKGGGYSLRYCGALVGDFHRCLLNGGIFLYPGEVNAGGKSTCKLRLMYEVAPLSMLAEQAGGAGSTGHGPYSKLSLAAFTSASRSISAARRRSHLPSASRTTADH